MATYRQVHTRIWQDPDFEEYSTAEKVIHIWLITNTLTTESGIYPVSFRRISNETGIPTKEVEQIFEKGLKNISYDYENRCVFIHNFTRYNGRGRPDLLEASIVKDCENTRTDLWQLFIDRYPRFAAAIRAKLKELNDAASISSSSSISIDTLDKSLPTLDQVPEEKKETYKKDKDHIETWRRINILIEQLKKTFPEINDFVGLSSKQGVHPGAILEALERCFEKSPDKPWAYCTRIVKIESGNYHYNDFRKDAIKHKEIGAGMDMKDGTTRDTH